tara:strand:- start:1566 stop:1874 length:309 start_codon:yes stop_codon:yes gene_type:complete
MARTEGLKPIGDSIRKIIDKVMEERKKRKRNRPIRTQPKLPGLKKGGPPQNVRKKRFEEETESRDKPPRSMIKNRGISGMKEGGICRGAGAAIKGTKFQGVF